jgi:hypothetical protein
MKTDHFAEFRRHAENPGNTGNRVTDPENPKETNDFCPSGSVTHDPDGRVTRVTNETSPAAPEPPVTRVTQASGKRVTDANSQKTAQNRAQSESVTRVTRVTHENNGAGEIRTEIERIARVGAERREADRQAKRADVLDSATEAGNLSHPVCPACHGSDLRVSPAGGLVCQGCGRFLILHAGVGAGADAPAYPALPLRRCGSLICRDCHAHSPGPHREGCRAPRFEPCRSRWFWLSPYRAIKCVACANPADLALVEAWILAREKQEAAAARQRPAAQREKTSNANRSR